MNGMKETYENQISFTKINSVGMEIILEYIYTGSVKEETLTKVEDFYAAIARTSSLRYFLFITSEKETPFATREYDVFRYSAILAAKKVSDNTYRALVERLPTLKQIDLEQIENSIESGNKLLIDHQKVTKELEPLLNLSDFRGKPINESGYVWDETLRQHVVQNLLLKITEKLYKHQLIRTCEYACVGVCASKNFNYEAFARYQPNGWVLGSGGYFNGTKYREVPEWYILPSKLYPEVSLCYPGSSKKLECSVQIVNI
ncbi:hypothetical protein GLOIN_2v1777841 [Rhizophagus irregularis DAOM 181602=DAOM 197198]|uniref:BTB domain-containing protein n=1 Tax=Rhizophagus irregularis (strain DAOM 181602 / DAOM 197198 / MUCL 43194) TaxID=747089 RepID=A0A2P4PU09_RHIID|nr:hypothetical protein GLOIN_2v1777841 [Rhizophagus irregularis DAOM 181602=DAOM 197198]POG68872.1 hypothetical protein GLOIN_2v1777841 [Rhizophagus irregularis DAOM 181602=DAOM 197198]GBC28653.2 hypothetical protein GLOIN_2v1777841 [Rhizophagus irregularis DAOM 181602=DAOM 197198]|eukprot:XP_025175738.1 hypothetical protein GLOIN_2v1777841 [Rhizophagus irregularis DAOM 181602=DAOM 197198]